jgi:hypothetical protein
MRRIGIGHGVMSSRNIDYRLVVDNAPALVFSARPDGYVDYFNRPPSHNHGTQGAAGPYLTRASTQERA